MMLIAPDRSPANAPATCFRQSLEIVGSVTVIPGLSPDTRELTVHPDYRLIYELVGDDVHILNVVHARRDWLEA